MSVILLDGIPGAGKSLMATKMIINGLKRHEYVIVNFPVNVKEKDREHCYYQNYDSWWNYPYGLIERIKQIRECSNRKITVYIDEAQVLFRSRDWCRPGRKEWLEFLQFHRHYYNLDVVLIAQSDRMLDKFVRGVLEEEHHCDRVDCLGVSGMLLSMFTLFRLHRCLKTYYSARNVRIGTTFYICSRKLRSFYNTYENFKIS